MDIIIPLALFPLNPNPLPTPPAVANKTRNRRPALTMTSTETTKGQVRRSYLPRTREKVQVQGLSVPGMYLKPRDLLTLLKVGQYRELTATQIEVLLYNSAQFS